MNQTSFARTSGGTPRPTLDPTLSFIARRDGAVQVGLNPERALVLTPPPGVESAQLIRVLRLLDGELTRPRVFWLASELGVQPQLMVRLLSELELAGLLVNADSPVTEPQLFRILGSGPIADVLSTDLEESGFRIDRSSGRNVERRCRTIDVQRWKSDFVVLTDDVVPNPRLVLDLIRAKIPHMLVRLRDGQGIVGPLVLPGSTSCLRCIDLTRCDYDSDWPYISAQLLDTVGRADMSTVRATAALTASQLGLLIDPSARSSPTALGCTLELDLDAGTIDRRRWLRHPKCDCWTV